MQVLGGRRVEIEAAAGAPGWMRVAGWLSLCLAEVLATSFLFEINAAREDAQNPIFYATSLFRVVLIAAPFFVFLAWPRRALIAQAWARHQARHNWRPALALNLVLFALLSAASSYISAEAMRRGAPPWELLPSYLALVAATGLSLLRIDVPLSALAAIAWSERACLLAAAAAGSAVALASTQVVAYVWPILADATLRISAFLVALFVPTVVVDPLERSLGAGTFKVLVDQSCSGYEGLALVAGFVSIYLWTFRSALRFPAAFLLYPIGLVAIWLLNSVRIAVLMLIGATLSPQVAAQGFHSQAGWISFLLVSIGLVIASRRLGLLTRPAQAPAARRALSRTEAFMIPFIALMAGSIIAAMLAPYDRPAYVIKAAVAAIAIAAVWRQLRLAGEGASWLAVTAGAAVGAAWIATDPKADAPQDLGLWLETLGPWLALAWLTVRGIGTIVLVPIAEELAFRGYLYRRLVSETFESEAASRLSWLALVVSSALFGALHERWLAAALAGAVFALVMVRTGSVRSAIVAHAVANAMIFAWAVLLRQWSLL
ncbi:MAG: exosortase E/protease, VPEID-CTERM system [Hyphomicrobiaceae bacterium]|nr:exosortase E/protease, VPEID-CTERM system [Hyphomicrobiaceae bacterium]